MKNSCLLACVLGVLVIALFESACASASANRVPVRELRTYAIIADDDQGTLSQTELPGIADTLVQILLDQGYVRSDQTLVDDPGRAATVFRIKIAWNEGRTSFAVISVAPEPGGASIYAGIAPAYASSVPPPYNDWDYDPWMYDDNFGYAYGPYCPFLTIFPFIPFYGFDHHRRLSPLIIYRPPDEHRPHSEHRPPAWDRYRHYVPPWQTDNGPRSPLLSPRRPGPAAGHERSSAATLRRTNPPLDRRSRPQNSSPGQPADRDHRPPTTDSSRTSPRRPPVDNPARPRDTSTSHPQNHDSDNRRSPDSAQRQPLPTGHDRSAPASSSTTRTSPPPGSERRPAPDYSARHTDANVRAAPATVPSRAPAPPHVSAPPTALPARQSAPPPRFTPPPPRNFSPPPPSRQSFSPPPSHPSPPPPPASSSNSSSDSKSSGHERER